MFGCHVNPVYVDERASVWESSDAKFMSTYRRRDFVLLERCRHSEMSS